MKKLLMMILVATFPLRAMMDKETEEQAQIILQAGEKLLAVLERIDNMALRAHNAFQEDQQKQKEWKDCLVLHKNLVPDQVTNKKSYEEWHRRTEQLLESCQQEITGYTERLTKELQTKKTELLSKNDAQERNFTAFFTALTAKDSLQKKEYIKQLEDYKKTLQDDKDKISKASTKKELELHEISINGRDRVFESIKILANKKPNFGFKKQESQTTINPIEKNQEEIVRLFLEQNKIVISVGITLVIGFCTYFCKSISKEKNGEHNDEKKPDHDSIIPYGQ